MRSTTTVRGDRPAVGCTSVSCLAPWLAFRAAPRTASSGNPIKDAAISTCCWRLSVNPRAAKIASSSVGGSCLTRRLPYLVFQALLIVQSPHVQAEYRIYAALQQ